MSKQKSNTGLYIVLLICGIIIGAVGAVLVMNFANKDSVTETEAVQNESILETEADETEISADDPIPTDETEIAVIKVGDAGITMKEVNIHMYQLRDFYTAQYGEAPWDTVLEDGTTLREYAKEELKNGLVRTEILINKAEEYGVSLTDEEKQTCADEAKSYIASIGPVICEDFALTEEADRIVREKQYLSTKVYNAALESLAETEEDTSESALAQAFEELFETWKTEYTITEDALWENIVMGSVG